jgi:hypothetical protein
MDTKANSNFNTVGKHPLPSHVSPQSLAAAGHLVQSAAIQGLLATKSVEFAGNKIILNTTPGPIAIDASPELESPSQALSATDAAFITTIANVDTGHMSALAVIMLLMSLGMSLQQAQGQAAKASTLTSFTMQLKGVAEDRQAAKMAMVGGILQGVGQSVAGAIEIGGGVTSKPKKVTTQEDSTTFEVLDTRTPPAAPGASVDVNAAPGKPLTKKTHGAITTEKIGRDWKTISRGLGSASSAGGSFMHSIFQNQADLKRAQSKLDGAIANAQDSLTRNISTTKEDFAKLTDSAINMISQTLQAQNQVISQSGQSMV